MVKEIKRNDKIRFIFDLAVFSAVLLMVLICITLFHYAVIGNSYEQSYNASLIDKINRLDCLDGKKIILVGDSSVPFGVNCKLIEEKLGYGVVDLGLYRSLGNAFAENCCKNRVGSGDIVVIMHSQMFDDNDDIPRADIAWLTVEYHRNLWEMIRLKDIPDMIRAYPNYIKNTTVLFCSGKQNQVKEDSSYRRDAFNEYGDISYRPKSGKWDLERLLSENSNIPTRPGISEKCIDRINGFSDYVEKYGGTVLVAAPPIFYHNVLPDSKAWMEHKKNLEKRLKCDVISDYTDYFYSDDLFYNSVTHLTDYGAEIRTKQLIEDIQEWMVGKNDR